jgi:predicted tellurium resistance membrane protein TerC
MVTRHAGPQLALVAMIVGVLGMLVAAFLQALLVARVVQYEQTIGAVLAAGGVVGLWLVLANAQALGGAVLPGGLVICGMATGVGYMLLAVGFRIGGQEHPLSYAGAGVVLVGYSVWAIWLGSLFASSALA